MIGVWDELQKPVNHGAHACIRQQLDPSGCLSRAFRCGDVRDDHEMSLGARDGHHDGSASWPPRTRPLHGT